MKVAVLDIDSMLYSAFMPNKVADPETGEPLKIDGKFVYTPKTDEQIEQSLDGMMYHMFAEGGFTHYLSFVKGTDTIKDRLIANPSYKQQRNKEQPEKWEFTKQYAINRWGTIEVNNIEVDDAVRICIRRISNSHAVAIDKDVLWLEGTNFNWRKCEWTTVNAQQEEEYLSRSLICGDTVDNLKGLPGKGEAYCDKHNIYTVPDAFRAYINELGLERGVDEFYRHFKCLYILTESPYFTEIPTPLEVPKIKQNDESEVNESRSTSRKLFNS